MKKEKKLYFIGHHKEWSMIATDIIARPLAVFTARYTPLTANQISIISFFFVIAGAFFLVKGGYNNILIGSLFAFFYNVLDMMDGMVARERKQSSIVGQWLDGVIGFFAFQILVIALAIGLKSYFALILGLLAVISYPTQYVMLFYFKAEVMPYQNKTPLPGKLDKLRDIYGLSFFYLFFPVAAFFNKSWLVLVFWATFGNLYWMLILLLQYLQLRQFKNNKGKPKYAE